MFVAQTVAQNTKISWQIQQSGLTSSFRGLGAVDEKVAWVSGSRGSFARTIDGGKKWLSNVVAGADSLDFRDIEAFDENSAFIMSAGPGGLSRVYKTENGGKSWQHLYTNPHPEGFFDGMAFWDANNGIVYGDPVDGKIFIMTTSDGGASWQRVSPDALPAMREGEYGFAASGTGIAVYGESHAWICTGGSAARVFRSTDKGKSWHVAETPIISGQPSTGIFSLAFRDAKNGIAVGGDYQKPKQARATVARTTDGGKSWVLVENASLVTFRSCVGYVPNAGANLLVAVGSHGASYSADAGLTWQPIVGPGYHTPNFGGSMSAGWVAGADGRVTKIVLKMN
ncbi:MAG: WD40/YVTN/BNR-like repeat-containing protein [bacterium]